MPSTPEGIVKAKVRKLLDGYKSAGLWYFAPVSTGHGTHGIPDFIICYFGRFIAVECKAHGMKPTPLQKLQMSMLDHAGAFVFVVDGDVTELRVLLERITSEAAYEH